MIFEEGTHVKQRKCTTHTLVPRAIWLMLVALNSHAQTFDGAAVSSAIALSQREQIETTPKFTVAMTEYLANQNLERRLAEHQRARAAARKQSGERSSVEEMKSEWLTVRTDFPRPDYHQANARRAEMCESADGLSGRELAALAPAVQSMYATRRIEEEEFWKNYYNEMTAEEQEKVDAAMQQLSTTRTVKRVDYADLANQSPGYFQHLIGKICSRARTQEAQK